MKYLFTQDEMRRCESTICNVSKRSLDDLMRAAGQSAYVYLRRRYPNVKKVAIMCGKGMNGGDGIICAQHALDDGLEVDVFHIDEKIAKEHGYIPLSTCPLHALQDTLQKCEVVIDALLGTGLRKDPLPSIMKSSIKCINQSRKIVISLDIPSGLHADTGDICEEVVRANHTLCFLGLKRGLFTAKGPDVIGDVTCQSLEEEKVVSSFSTSCILLDQIELKQKLIARSSFSHKGTYGSVLIIGGDEGYGGAVLLAAQAALRSGAGSVVVGTKKQHVAPLLARCPEVMAHSIDSFSDLEGLLQKRSCIAIGPGLGKGKWGQELMEACVQTDLPLIVDADGLALLDSRWTQKRTNSTIVTPHIGEAARMLGTTSLDVNSDRFSAAKKLSHTYRAIVALKGKGTIIQANTDCYLSPYGNPTMATAGMGDVLTGTIAGIISQGYDSLFSVKLGVVTHGLAGDIVVKERGSGSMLASDILVHYSKLLSA